MQLIDSHCHLDDVRFRNDLIDVIDRARSAGVTSFVVPAIAQKGWAHLASLAREIASLYAAYGLHPWFCKEHCDADIERLPGYLQNAVAVGECGLDFGKGRAVESEQLKWFRAQLEIAVQYEKPVIVHAYKAEDVVLRELKNFPEVKGVIHGFSGSTQQATHLMDHGLYIGIGSAVSYPQATRLRDIVRVMPIERLLLESDAPDQSPFAHRGERNEPAWLVETTREIAEIRGVSTDELIAVCNRNAKELFKL